MAVYAIFCVKLEGCKIVKEAFNLEKFGFFARMQIKNILRALAMDFTKNMISRPDVGNNYLEIEETIENEKIFIATKADTRNRYIVITDGEYNANVRFKATNESTNITNNYEKLILEYKNWKDKDISTQVEKELKKANDNVIKGLSAVLGRGKSLNELVEKSENLSSQTKQLYKTAKRQNSCC